MVGKFESNKDLVQELTSSGAQRVGNIAAIITGTVSSVAREIGEFITDVIEMNEAAAAARRDAEQDERRSREEVVVVDDVDVTTEPDDSWQAEVAEPKAPEPKVTEPEPTTEQR
ncbi:hypothetical protein [Nocardia mangyaensis]|uniref:hypothetical protein n=1 Tax=Nocardia mangyaensis TaxID=2213200 RepID=UPI000A7F21BB|nr:hypothetical protein [Nocardia mangyaensis]